MPLLDSLKKMMLGLQKIKQLITNFMGKNYMLMFLKKEMVETTTLITIIIQDIIDFIEVAFIQHQDIHLAPCILRKSV